MYILMIIQQSYIHTLALSLSPYLVWARAGYKKGYMLIYYPHK